MKRLSLSLVLILLACACDRNADMKEIMEDPTIRLSVQGVTQFTYKPQSCQLGFCREKREFRVHTDNMSDYFTVTLDKIPTSGDTQVNGDIIWTASSSLEHRTNVTFKVLKLEGDIIWLWNEADKMSAVIRILE